MTAANAQALLADGATMAQMTSEQAGFAISSVVDMRAVDRTHFTITNHSPVNLTSVVLTATIKGASAPVQLYTATRLDAFRTTTVTYPFVGSATMLPSADGSQQVDLSAFATGVDPASITFDFGGTSPTVTKLKTLSNLKWQLRFKDFDTENSLTDNWFEDPTPVQFRRTSAYMINFAYMVQAKEFKDAFLAAPEIGNDGVTYMTAAEKAKAYDDLVNHQWLNLGVTANAAEGLGGGATLGMANWVTYYGIHDPDMQVIAHEWGHVIGFNHSSTMTYARTIDGKSVGFVPVAGAVYRRMMVARELPVDLDNYSPRTDFEAGFKMPTS